MIRRRSSGIAGSPYEKIQIVYLVLDTKITFANTEFQKSHFAIDDLIYE